MSRPAAPRVRRLHALAVSVLLAGAAVLGMLAATRTLELGASVSRPKSVSDAVIAQRTRKLDAFQASLRRTLGKQPGTLPAVPRFAPVHIPAVPVAPPPPVSGTVAAAPPATPRPAAPRPVKYVRPPPVVKKVRPAPQPAPASGSREDDHEEHGDGASEQARLDAACKQAIADFQAAQASGTTDAERLQELQKQADEKCREAQKHASEHAD